jgi:hypothetical protein
MPRVPADCLRQPLNANGRPCKTDTQDHHHGVIPRVGYHPGSSTEGSAKVERHTLITRTAVFCVLASAVCISAIAKGQEKCYPQKVDPSWNRNDNKPGTACHKQVQKVRKLEFHPNFDCSKEIRQQWEREYDIAKRMKCTL